MATKRLARQLGLIRRKSIASASGNPGRSRLKQMYDYLIVIDFESTCWKDGKHHNSPEIIEFPAVLLNTATGEIESEFHAYVQPQEHPILSEFCTELTGIKQVQVDEGVPLKICLSQFCKWIHRIQQQKKISFTTGGSEPSSEVKLCAFVTWSDWDLGVCLEYECRRKQLLKPVFLNSWIDLRATYKLFYKRKPKGLNGALQEVGIEFSGREHSGLDDSRNTALLAWKMMRDGCLMTITRSLNKVLTKKNPKIFVRNLDTDQVEETTACSISIQGPSIYQKEPKSTANTQENAQMNLASVNSSIKDQLQLKTNTTADLHNIKRCLSLVTTKPSASVEQLCSPPLNPALYMQKQRKSEQLAVNDKSQSSALKSNLVLVSTTIPSVNVSDGEVGCAFDCLPMLAEWEEVALLPASQAEQDGDCVSPISDTNVDNSFNSGERSMVLREPEILSYENFQDFKEAPQNFETSKSIVYKSPHSTVYKVKGAKHPGLDASTFKLPECKPITFNSLNANSLHSSVLRKQPLLGVTKRNSSSPLAFPQAKKQTFTVYEEKSETSSSPGTSSQKGLPSVLTSTVNLQEPWESGKMTPPLCKCGRRSKRLIVSNNGPNHGKAFYCCPVGKYQEDRKCCGYFKWELTLKNERANSKALSHSSEGLTFSSPESSHTHDRNLSFPIKNSLRLRPSMRN